MLIIFKLVNKNLYRERYISTLFSLVLIDKSSNPTFNKIKSIVLWNYEDFNIKYKKINLNYGLFITFCKVPSDRIVLALYRIKFVFLHNFNEIKPIEKSRTG